MEVMEWKPVLCFSAGAEVRMIDTRAFTSTFDE